MSKQAVTFYQIRQLYLYTAAYYFDNFSYALINWQIYFEWLYEIWPLYFIFITFLVTETVAAI